MDNNNAVIKEAKRIINEDGAFEAFCILYQKLVENWSNENEVNELLNFFSQHYAGYFGWCGNIDYKILGRFSMETFDISSVELAKYFDFDRFEADHAEDLAIEGFEGEKKLNRQSLIDVYNCGYFDEVDEYLDFVQFAKDCIEQGDYLYHNGYFFLNNC